MLSINNMNPIDVLKMQFPDTEGCVRIVTPDDFGYTNFFLDLNRPYLVTTDLQWKCKDAEYVVRSKHKIDMIVNLVAFDDKSKTKQILLRMNIKKEQVFVRIYLYKDGKKYKKNHSMEYILVEDIDMMAKPYQLEQWNKLKKIKNVDTMVDHIVQKRHMNMSM